MNFDLDKIKRPVVAFFISFVIAVILTGILFIFSFNKSFFETHDLIIVILLGCSITSPIWLLNSIFVLYVINEPTNEKELFLSEIAGIFASIVIIFIFYIPILIKLYFDLSFNVAVITVLALNLAIFIFYLIIHRADKKSKK